MSDRSRNKDDKRSSGSGFVLGLGLAALTLGTAWFSYRLTRDEVGKRKARGVAPNASDIIIGKPDGG